jgi:hypothetical protein
MKKFLATAVMIASTAPSTLSAHRLDEYLHATRLAVATDRIDLEMDLTPGAALADAVFESIDADHDGTISTAEARAYGTAVLRYAVLRLDGQPLSPSLVGFRSPQLAEMREGLGVLQISATARVRQLSAGNHQLYFRNGHQPDRSVYLVNALVPSNPSISIVAQHRDVEQHEVSVDFRVASAWGSMAGIAMVTAAISLPAALMWSRRRSVHAGR